MYNYTLNTIKWNIHKISSYILFVYERVTAGTMALAKYDNITQAITSGNFNVMEEELENGFNANTGPEVSFFLLPILWYLLLFICSMEK